MNKPIQTNLFNRALLPKVDWFSTNRMALSICIFSVFMAILSAASLVSESMKTSTVSTLEHEVEQLRSRKIEQFPVSIRKKKEMLDKINASDEQIKSSRELLAGMGQAIPGAKSTSFTLVMSALSNVDNKFIWLDYINYGVTGRSLSLKGHSTDPKAIAEYIELLRAQPGISSVNLGQLEVSSDSSSEKLWAFSVTGLGQEVQQKSAISALTAFTK